MTHSKPWGELEIYSAEDEGDSDDEPLDFSTVWRRPNSEYQRGAARLKLCSLEEARFTHLNADLDLDSKASYITGVRGNAFHPEAYRNPDLRGEVWFELVPEPNNPHDPHALAVDLNGVRAGYVKATVAYYYQWMVRAANARGVYCITPGFIEHPSSSWIVLPTLELAHKVLDAQALMLRLRAIWDSLPAELRQRIESELFHPTKKTARQLWNFRHLDPALFPTCPDPEAYSIGWGRTLNAVRLERNARVAEERRAKREAAKAEKALRRKQREEATAKRNRRIMQLAKEGLSNATISGKLDVSSETVRRVRSQSQLRAQSDTNSFSSTPRR